MADVVLRCPTDGLPWARIQNRVLIVESRHLGERHVNVIAIDELLSMIEAAHGAEHITARMETDE